MPKIEISISNILEYLGNRVRPLKEGEAVFKAGHIILCGLNTDQPNNINSVCLQTSGLTKPPHEINIKLDTPWSCKCTCKAGLSGFCKHIVATLIYINRNEDLEYVSCTDIKQKWGKEKKGVKEVYSVKPFTSFCHPIKKKKYNYQTNDDINKRNFNLLVSGVGTSTLARFIGKTMSQKDVPLIKGVQGTAEMERTSTYEDIRNIFNHMEESQFLNKIRNEISSPHLQPCCRLILEHLSKTDIFKVACYTTQGSDAWNKERQLRITGSTCYSIYTYARGGNVDWEQKAKTFFFPKGFTNKFTAHGLRYEQEAFETFKNKNDVHIITPSLIIAKSMPWLAFSPDGVIFEGGVPTRLLEIKCPYIGKDQGPEIFLESCDYLELINSQPQLKVHHKYYGQVQLGMALLNLKKTHFIVYSSFTKNYLEVVVNFAEDFAQDLIKTVSKKYFENMLHNYCLNK